MDMDCDSVTNFVLRVVGRGQFEAELLGLVQDGQGDGMMKLLFRRGGVEEYFLGGMTGAGDDAADLGSFAGQRAGLVEENGIDSRSSIRGPVRPSPGCPCWRRGPVTRAWPAVRPSGCRCRNRY